MHVCHFCDTSLQGDYFRNIATGLSRKGVKVSLLELGPGSAPDWLSDMAGIEYFSLNAAGKMQYPLVVRRLAKHLRVERVDILHTHLFYAGLIGVLAKRLHKGTVVALMRHHTGVVRMLGSRLHIAADKWMAERADHVMTVSEAAKRYMVDVDKIGSALTSTSSIWVLILRNTHQTQVNASGYGESSVLRTTTSSSATSQTLPRARGIYN